MLVGVLLPTKRANELRGDGEIPLEDIPGTILKAIEDGALCTVLGAGTEFFRARVHGPRDRPTTAREIGTPPPQFAKANRMTAAGIGAFCGCNSADGALEEIRGYVNRNDHATLGKFVTLTEMVVVDLRNAPPVPSLFDTANRPLRAPAMFLRDFTRDVAVPARPDDYEHIEYVPTQIVTELVRYQLKSPAGPISGVLWRSSKDLEATVCVLFVSNDECVGSGRTGRPFGVGQSKPHVLSGATHSTDRP